jgi:hypothetical protein
MALQALLTYDTNYEAEELPNAVQRYWLHNRQIVIYSPGTVDRKAVDTWAIAVLEDIRNWGKAKRYFAIHDFSQITMTPYSKTKSEEVASQYPSHLRGCYGLVVKNNALGLAIKVFTQRELRRYMPHLECGFFFNLPEALQWVHEEIAE